MHVRDKITKYGKRLSNVEQGTFTPLVFTSAGEIAKQRQNFHKRVVELIAEKKGRENSSLLGCDVNFFNMFNSV